MAICHVCVVALVVISSLLAAASGSTMNEICGSKSALCASKEITTKGLHSFFYKTREKPEKPYRSICDQSWRRFDAKVTNLLMLNVT